MEHNSIQLKLLRNFYWITPVTRNSISNHKVWSDWYKDSAIVKVNTEDSLAFTTDKVGCSRFYGFQEMEDAA